MNSLLKIFRTQLVSEVLYMGMSLCSPLKHSICDIYNMFCVILTQYLKLRGHGNKFRAIATKNRICCNRQWMFHCVTMLNFFVSKHFLLKIFVAETNKKIKLI